jgi:hypothetical protein
MIKAVEKCQGLKKGEHVKPIAIIQVISKRREPLNDLIYDPGYGFNEICYEGFHPMKAEDFVSMYCKHNKCKPTEFITRIEFEYVE